MVAGTSVMIQHVDRLYHVAFHVVLLFFVVKVIKRFSQMKNFPYQFLVVFMYVAITYSLAVGINIITAFLDNTWIGLIIASIIYMPIIRFVIREYGVIERYKAAKKLEDLRLAKNKQVE